MSIQQEFTTQWQHKILMASLVNVIDNATNEIDVALTNTNRVLFIRAYEMYGDAFIIDNQDLTPTIHGLLTPLIEWQYDPFTHRVQIGD